MQLKVLIALVFATLAVAAPAEVIARGDDVDSYYHRLHTPPPHPLHVREVDIDDYHHQLARDDSR